jgi:predicted nucleic acid-binding protein
MRIFLDANILFSASLSDGAIRRLVRELLTGGHALVVDEYVLEEARRNLALKARDGAKELDRLKHLLEIAPSVADIQLTVAVALPEKDRPVLAAALQARCNALVTGDRTHFGRFYGRSIGGVAIHSPLSLAESLL